MATNRYKYFGNYNLLIGGYIGAFEFVLGAVYSISKAIGLIMVVQTNGLIMVVQTKGRLKT